MANQEKDDRIPVIIEVCLKSTVSVKHEEVHRAVARFLEGRTLWYRDASLDFSEEPWLAAHVEGMRVAETEPRLAHAAATPLLFWQYDPRIYVYQLSEEEPCEDDDEGEDGVPSYREWYLPSRDFEGQWEALHYEAAIKRKLLKYAASALLFADRGVNSQLVSWNRVVLLHGPPGTGKTSLCQALAHKLTARLGGRYTQGVLVEVNAHSLFSKWFSESGKLVSKLFSKIGELLEEKDTLVFVLIDEVESLTSARKAAVGGSEPSDAIRAVNALLTALDGLKRHPNAMVLTTSNITEAIDLAFVDRADIKAYIGPPAVSARYEILRSAVVELGRAGIVDAAEASALPAYWEAADSASGGYGPSPASALLEAAGACEGLSGRALRKLPFLTHASADELPTPCAAAEFLRALRETALRERQDRSDLNH